MKTRIGLAVDTCFCAHDTGIGHPESPDRITRIHEKLSAEGLLSECSTIAPCLATREQLHLVHDSAYIDRVEAAFPSGKTWLDSQDCQVSADTFSVASLAAGTACAAVDSICEGNLTRAFLATRPPGHHAEHAEAMGFCFFNSIAVAAAHAQQRHGVGRICIVDWDVHHGNGTQHMFEHTPDIFYISLHTHPAALFPGTGFPEEIGAGDGLGATLNIALQPHTPEREYLSVFEKTAVPAIEHFAPELILVSAGFDAHASDPLGNQSLSSASFTILTELVTGCARASCGGRLLSILEGGYHLDALARSTAAHVIALL